MPFFYKLSNFQKRVITGVVGITLILNAVYWNEWSYFFVFLFIMFFSLHEFYTLLTKSGVQISILALVQGIAIYTVFFLIQKKYLPVEAYILVLILPFILLPIQLYRLPSSSLASLAWAWMGLMYVVLPFSMLHLIAFQNYGYSFQMVMGILFLIWANDTGAYLVGKKWGKHKLFERISPGKTWEGFVGGFILALLVSLLISFYFKDISQWKWFVIAIIITVVGTYGDLVESMFKRNLQVKDSGTLIPGHGGFLDRFDAFLLAVPFVLAFLLFFH